jgi:sulfite reductase alpha subunit-like flavoprotein
MKRALWLVCLILLYPCLHGAESKWPDPIRSHKPEFRIVNSIRVDVAPVRIWLQEGEGERPMKHWRQLQVVSLKGPVSTMHQCIVKTEEGKLIEVLVKNLPQSVSEFLADFNNHDQAIARLQTEISDQEASLRREEAVHPTGVMISGTYVEIFTREATRLNRMTNALQEKRELLAKLTAERETMRSGTTEATSILAMYTGRSFINLPVWDCGISK